MALVELVHERSDKNDAISLASVLVFDNANDWDPSELALDDLDVHGSTVPRSIRLSHGPT
jgi:hypothetical protein